MNKTLNINLGGYPFIINDDAYDLLSRYLGSIHRHFKSSSSYADITGDIENRLAEIFQQNMGNRSIVELKDVQSAIEVMGNPEDFGAEPIDNQPNSGFGTQSEYRTGKRLFREPEDKVFGGICSGIAAYFGIQDPLWVRILFVLLVFVFGMSAIFYFILWIAIPEALSSADRLAMRGEPINVSNIAKVVEEEFNNLSDAYNGAGKNGAEKKNSAYSGQYASPNRGRAGQAAADGFSFIGDVFRRIFDIIRMIFKPIFGFIGVIGLIVLGAFWIALVMGFAYGHPFVKALFGDSSVMAYCAGANVFFMVAALIAILVMAFLNIFFKVKVHPKWYGILGAFWFVNGASFAFTGAHLGQEFSSEGSIKTELFNVNLPSDTLNIDVIKNRRENFKINLGNVRVNNENLTYNGVDLRVKRSEGNEFRLEKVVESNGRSIEEAEQLAMAVNYTPKLEGSTFTCDESIDLTGQKFRGQRVTLTLYVPQGKYIRYGRNAHNFIAFDYDDYYDCEDENDIQVWQMQPSGEMMCPLAKKQNSAEKNFTNTGFKSLKISGNLDVEIRKGATYEVKLEGKEKLLKDVEIIQSATSLNVRSSIDDWDDKRTMRLIIIAPTLDLIDIEDAKDVRITGFSEKEMRMSFFGEMDVDIIADVDNLAIDIEKANVKLQGKGISMTTSVEENGELHAKQYTVKTAKVSLDNGGEADIYATERVENKGNSGSLDVMGGATIDKIKKKDEE
jgi:phage shock protein PspC (stress-responsive transcriptional regulator)